NDAMLVGLSERTSDLKCITERPFDRQPLFRDRLGERTSPDVLHDDIRVALSLPDLVNDADVRMVQTRGVLRFTPQACLGARVAARHQLDGHRALEAAVVGLIDLAHSAHAESATDLVVADDS